MSYVSIRFSENERSVALHWPNFFSTDTTARQALQAVLDAPPSAKARLCDGGPSEDAVQ